MQRLTHRTAPGGTPPDCSWPGGAWRTRCGTGMSRHDPLRTGHADRPPGPHRIPPCPLPGDATSVGKGVAPSRHPSPAPATSSTACGRRTPAAGTRHPAPRTTRSAQRTASPRCPHGPGEGKATAPPQGAGNPPDNSPHATPAPLPNKRPSAIRGPYSGAVRGPLYPLAKAISLGPTPFAVDRIALCSAVGKLTA